MFQRRLNFLLVAFGIFFLILISRFFFLQIVRGDDYLRSVLENRRQIQYFKGERGRILDRNGEVLARNRQSKDIAIIMSRILQRDSAGYRYDMPALNRLVNNVAAVLQVDQGLVRKKINRVYEKITRKPFVYKGETIHDAIVLFNDVGEQAAYEIEINRYDNKTTDGLTAREDRFPGIEIATTQTRLYPYGRLACHIIGYTGKISPDEKKQFYREEIHDTDRIGRCGVERYYEENLHGFLGKKMVDKLIRDKKIVYNVLKVEVPKRGLNITLTLDIRVQRIIVEALQRFENQVGQPIKAAGVMLNPQNGEVLALVSYPQYDTNSFIPSITESEFDILKKHPGKPLLNRCLRGYPPGSTYKPLMSVLATRENITIEDLICMGSITLGSGRRAARFRCWKSSGHGDMDQLGALRESCNIYFYELGRKVGIRTMNHYADMFGFGRATDLDLARKPEYEFPGINPSKAWKRATGRGGWVPGDTLNSSIGQGFVSATPLQIARMTGIVGTSGKITTPHLLKGFGYDRPGPEKRILDPNDFIPTRRGMHQVTMDERGTAYAHFHHLLGLGVNSAGKTGSAEVGKRLRTHSWYCGFCPYIDPVLAYSLIIENAGHGSDAAVPVMADIMRTIYEDDELRESLGLKKQTYYVPEEELHEIDPVYEEDPERPVETPPEDVRIIID